MQKTKLIDWLLKYKMHHVVFWLTYHLVWLLIYTGDFNEASDYLFFKIESIKFYFYLIFQFVGVYLNLYYLIPKYLYPGQYKTYVLLVMTTILTTSAFIACGYYLVDYLSDLSFYELFKLNRNEFLKIMFTQALPSSAASMTLAMSIKLGKNWLNAEKKKLILEKEKLETELKYLKSQINPHFLFNTINSIFGLIHQNPDLASESLANFSDMLRFQLYECEDAKVALSKDLKFLSNFIELEKLRLDEKHTDLNFEIINNANGLKISPFVLIPFVENAFKHVSKGKGRNNYIRMLLVTDKQSLNLEIENSVSTENKTLKPLSESSGIGLKNVRRRLDLIYKNRYILDIDAQKNSYLVNLKLKWA